MKTTLRVMKFGGTSVGDAGRIARVVGIIREAAGDGDVAVVVSAMGGVTNRLIEAANQARAGNEGAVASIFAELNQRHDEAVRALVHGAAERRRLRRRLHERLAEGERICHEAVRSRRLAPASLDAIAGLGERLSAPLVAAAFSEMAGDAWRADASVAGDHLVDDSGVRVKFQPVSFQPISHQPASDAHIRQQAVGWPCEAVEATELIVTDGHHGAAEPDMAATRNRAGLRLLPVLRAGVVPIVTGFIGATEAGVLTTLGRGGSDYSATILGAALDADEVVIWTDVSGMMTADPKLVGEARTIPEISYEEAAELAHFGAKVLHPKTLAPLAERGIPVWIKNTFAPGDAGTRITPAGPETARRVTAVTTIENAAAFFAAGKEEAAREDTATGREMGSDCDAGSSLITVVGHNLRAERSSLAGAFAALWQKHNVIAQERALPGASGCSLSFLVPRRELATAVAALHLELELGAAPGKRPAVAVGYEPEPATAD